MKPEPITLCRRIFREKASKQTFGINQNLVILPNISVPIDSVLKNNKKSILF